MTERNQLLVAARYAIEHPGPRGTELRQALDALAPVIDALPLPAYVVSRDWTCAGRRSGSGAHRAPG
ncbi:MAG TPA: hypothetical protein VF162_17125 [Streptosporangiaceae bacterium]